MSGTVNRIILIGNLGNHPEMRTAPDKFQVCTFSLATSRDWKDRNTGEQKSQTNWHSVVVWEPNAVTYAKNFLKKCFSFIVKCLATMFVPSI
jgi:single-strand DNA-binding protein